MPMTNHPVADYLESLAAKLRAGTHIVEIEKTEFERSVIVDVYEGEIYESPGEVDQSQYREVIRVSKVSQRTLC